MRKRIPFTVTLPSLALCVCVQLGCKASQSSADAGGAAGTAASGAAGTAPHGAAGSSAVGAAGDVAGGAAGDVAGGAAGDAATPHVVHVTEDITSPATWSSENLYVLDKSIAVSAELTIEPGTVVKLETGNSIGVNAEGSIVADAESASTPCIFTSIRDDAHGGDTNEDGADSAPAPGDWGHITIREDGSVFNYCQFLYGGAGMPYTGTLSLQNDCSATVTHCVFAHNQGGTPEDTRAAALNASGAAALVFTDNTFFDNDVPLLISGSFDVDDSNVFHLTKGGDTTGNAYNGIFWGGGYELAGDISWTNTDVPFVVAGNPVGVAEGSSLTLGDGVTVKFDLGQRIDVSGTLTADATSEILFTSLRDDSAGGDTNGDGEATAPVPGDWGWINLAADGSLLNGCRFSYAGSGAPYHGTVELTHNHTATITGCTFAHNAGGTLADNRAAALNLGGAAAGTVVTGNVFYDNQMPLVINGLVDLDGSNVFHRAGGDSDTPLLNTYNGIFMDGTLHAVSGSVTWTNQEVAYVMGSTVLTIETGGSLTLGDDVVLKFADGRVDVIGSLVEGSNDTFTSLFDDSLLGDTNGDGDATAPADGDWPGVNICQQSPCFWATWDNILYATNP